MPKGYWGGDLSFGKKPGSLEGLRQARAVEGAA